LDARYWTRRAERRSGARYLPPILESPVLDGRARDSRSLCCGNRRWGSARSREEPVRTRADHLVLLSGRERVRRKRRAHALATLSGKRADCRGSDARVWSTDLGLRGHTNASAGHGPCGRCARRCRDTRWSPGPVGTLVITASEQASTVVAKRASRELCRDLHGA